MPSNVNLTYRAFLGYNTYYYCVATVLCLKGIGRGEKGGGRGRISTEINEEHPSKLLQCVARHTVGFVGVYGDNW